MKKIFTFFGAVVLLASAAQVQAQFSFYPGLTAADSVRTYLAPKATTPLVIDGNPTDAAWALAPWKSAIGVTTAVDPDWTAVASAGTPVAPEGAFSGVEDGNMKYKIIWDADHYYILFRLVDDKIIYTSKHGGYQKGRIPAYGTGLTFPLPGASTDGSILNAWRMDAIQYWITTYSDAKKQGGTFSRNNDAVWFGIYPGFITNTNAAEPGVLRAASHNTVGTADLEQPHNSTAAGSYNETEKAYYIEIRDTTWTTLFANTRSMSSAWIATPYVPKVGDKFLMHGEYNDADGITNRRDYQLMMGWLYPIAGKNSLNNLQQGITIELVETVPAGLINTKASQLDIYPNPVKGNVINLKSIADVKIFNLSGHMILESKNASKIDITALNQGVYMVKDNAGNINKLVRQ